MKKWKKRTLQTLCLLIAVSLSAKLFFEIEGSMLTENMNAPQEPKTLIEHKKLEYEGYDIHYYVSGKPDGELVLFLHPAFSDHSAFDRQVDYFSNKYKVITIDLIGHGLSQVRKSDDKIDASPRHISDIMLAEGHEKTHLVGVSMGALVAQYFAVSNPQKVLTLTSLGGYDINKLNPEVKKAQGNSNFGLILRALFSMRSFRAKVAATSAHTPEGQSLFYKSASLFTRKSFMVMRGFENIVKDRQFVPSYTSLILVGAYDIPLARSMAQTWHSKLTNSKYVEIEGAGHCANMDAPEVFNKIVDEMLTK